jgi:hypothetical protein
MGEERDMRGKIEEMEIGIILKGRRRIGTNNGLKRIEGSCG